MLTDSKNGELTQAARQKLITDLEHAGLSAKKAQEAVDAYSKAVGKNGINSKQAQAARAQLLKDLQGAGTAGKKAGDRRDRRRRGGGEGFPRRAQRRVAADEVDVADRDQRR